MKAKIIPVLTFGMALAWAGAALTMAQSAGSAANVPPPRPQGPCDIYAAAGDPCVAAHSTTRALYASYNGPLYQVRRQSDGKTLDVGLVRPTVTPVPDPGGYADAAAQDAFCANTVCWITEIYDQSPRHNDLTQAPRGGFSGPAMGGLNNLPIADMAPATVMGHKVYGVFIEPGMGLRDDHPAGTAVDDQAEGQYWVVNGRHYNGGCCFDYGNAEIDSRDDDNGTMETAYFGDARPWFHGSDAGPWIMTDQENNLVGCVNPEGTKSCPNLPSITWRFVTAMANGEPHHWMTMGGNAQHGDLSVMFSGPRVNATYDPMRKQGAILLGNGGDNSNGSQGTFYEGAITAGGTFPSEATEQRVQSNIVAAGYAAAPLSLAPASATAAPPGLQIFSPSSSQDVTLTFTNTSGSPATDVELSVAAPSQWKSAVASGSSKAFPGPIAPGDTVSANFKITSGPKPFNGDLIGNASWENGTGSAKRSATTTEVVRNVAPVRINEFRISSGPPSNLTDSFIELYNAGSKAVDIADWTLTIRPTQHAVFSSVKIPANTRLAPHAFYLLGLSNSGLAAPARTGDATIYVRSTAGMNPGDTVTVGSGSSAETRKIVTVGTAAGVNTTLWEPLPDGPVITIPAGDTNVPVSSTSGFATGEKMALGYGATYPTDPAGMEQYEIATVTGIGKAGTQAYLAADAPAGATNIKVTSVDDISTGDKIRLDIDSLGHGIETVTVNHVGTAATRARLADDASAGATSITVRQGRGFAVGDQIIIGDGIRQTVTISAIDASGQREAKIDFTPALDRAHIRNEDVVQPGTGLDLAAPLKFNHAANLPFSDRGTGITFRPATAFAHISDEPVQPLGTGITLSEPLSHDHAIDAVVRDAAITTAGYQGTPAPNQWFGGPELAAKAPLFGRMLTLDEGSMVLRNAAGLVVDSLNYGGMADPWAAEGYQAASGQDRSGCYVTAPGPSAASARFAPPAAPSDVSAGRDPDGEDTGSNCTDFVTAPATALLAPSDAGAANIKVDSVEGFVPGQTIHIDTGANLETASVAAVGTAGATTLRAATDAGATEIPVAGFRGFNNGQAIEIGSGADAETATIASIARFPTAALVVTSPLAHAHAMGALVSGTGITLAAPLTREHAGGASVTGSPATPGAQNHFYRKSQ